MGFSSGKAGTTDYTDDTDGRRPNTHGPAEAHASEATSPNGPSASFYNLCESVKSVDQGPFLRHLRHLRLNVVMAERDR